jgi:putative aldouronate transport system substrate-binding protein
LSNESQIQLPTSELSGINLQEGNQMKMRKVIALIMSAAMVAAIVGCGDTPETAVSPAEGAGSASASGETTGGNVNFNVPEYLNTDSIMPIVKDGHDITLRFMVALSPAYANMSSLHDVYFVDAYARKNNVNIEWETMIIDVFNNRVPLGIVSGDLPDVYMKGGFSNSAQLRFGNQGAFLNLMEDDLLKNHAPNYWALAQQFPEILAATMTADGAIYSTGLVRNSSGSLITSRLFFNEEWLDRLDLSVPTTQDEFYNVLYHFRHSDPNGNGRNDEIGFYISRMHLEYVTLGMFGVGNRGRFNNYVDWDYENERVRYFAASDGFREWVEWVAKLYSEGLLHREFLSYSDGMAANFVTNDVSGVIGWTNLGHLDSLTQQKFTYLAAPLVGNNGGNSWFGSNSIGSTGAYVISTACKHPEVAMRWVDYLYTDEGSLFFYYGTEGVTFERNNDGTFRYTDAILADYLTGRGSFISASAQVSLFQSTNHPVQTKFPFNAANDNNGIARDAARALVPYVPKAWPAFTFTNAENRIIEDQRRDIEDYVRSMTEGWIVGRTVLDDNAWQSYVRTLNAMGLPELLEVYEAALARAYAVGFVEGFYSLSDFD